MTGFAIAVGILTLATLPGWLGMIRCAASDDLHAYAALIPLVSAWLGWQTRATPSQSQVPDLARTSAKGLIASALGLAALASLVCSYLGKSRGWFQHDSSWLASQMLPWVLGTWAAAAAILPVSRIRTHLFPLGFLLFTIPIPEPLVALIEQGLQHASASAVEAAFKLMSVSYVRDERYFWLPHVRFEVAQECSGVRSTVVLFITSVIGGYLLLRSGWSRTMLAAVVLPLGILRNAFRICTITLLSSKVDPTIIHSALHHRGGPIFFAISLIPFFLLLWWLRRRESHIRA